MSKYGHTLLLRDRQDVHFMFNLQDDSLYVNRISDDQPLYKVSPSTCVYRYQEDQWVKVGRVYVSSLGDKMEFTSDLSPHQNIVIDYTSSKTILTYQAHQPDGAYQTKEVVFQEPWIGRMVYNDGPYLALETVLIQHWLDQETHVMQAA
jgi:hypothetical protein